MADQPLESEASIVIVGAGIMGLSIAYNLALLGVEGIVVVDKGYLCSGASGRNGGGVRAQWSDETNIRLMKRSLERCRDFATRMRVNVWFRPGGYLFLARTESRLAQLKQSVELQQEHALPTRIIERAEISRLVPELDVSSVLAASFNPDDGVVFPWPFVWGYAEACQSMGVKIHPHTEVTALELTEEGATGARISGVRTARGAIATGRVICAAGAWSPEVVASAGVELPSRPHRHEICATEPLKHFLRPLVGDLDSGLYFSQSMRGEIVGGISNKRVPEGLDQGSSLRFLGLYSKALCEALPIVSGIRVMRQWAGCYDLTPDGSPLMGEVDEVRGLTLSSGFMGHGFMMAPIIGELVARNLVHGEEQELFERWNLRRFREGRLLNESMILG